MVTNKLQVVLDTNILLVSISSSSPYHWIFGKLLNSEYNLAITNDILSEYEEIISIKFNADVSKNIIRTLLILPNIRFTDVYYKWNLIPDDQDDNKFVDCAIASGSDYIVTNDKHFNIIKTVSFPKITVIDIEKFKNVLL